MSICLQRDSHPNYFNFSVANWTQMCWQWMPTQSSWVCPPSVVSNRQGAIKGLSGRGYTHPGHTSSEESACISQDPNGLSCPSPKYTINPNPVSELRLPSPTHSNATSRLEGFRKHLKARGLSESAISLISASWRKKTNSNYNSAWRV